MNLPQQPAPPPPEMLEQEVALVNEWSHEHDRKNYGAHNLIGASVSSSVGWHTNRPEDLGWVDVSYDTPVFAHGVTVNVNTGTRSPLTKVTATEQTTQESIVIFEGTAELNCAGGGSNVTVRVEFDRKDVLTRRLRLEFAPGAGSTWYSSIQLFGAICSKYQPMEHLEVSAVNEFSRQCNPQGYGAHNLVGPSSGSSVGWHTGVAGQAEWIDVSYDKALFVWGLRVNVNSSSRAPLVKAIAVDEATHERVVVFEDDTTQEWNPEIRPNYIHTVEFHRKDVLTSRLRLEFGPHARSTWYSSFQLLGTNNPPTPTPRLLDFFASDASTPRVEFLISKAREFSDVVVVVGFGDGQSSEFPVYRSLLSTSELDVLREDRPVVNVVLPGIKSLNLSPNDLLAYLFGRVSVDSLMEVGRCDDLIDIFLILRALKMNRLVWHLSEMIQGTELSWEKVHALLACAHKRLVATEETEEDGEDEDVATWCSLGVSCMNYLRLHPEVRDERKVCRWLQGRYLYLQAQGDPIPLKTHRDCEVPLGVSILSPLESFVEFLVSRSVPVVRGTILLKSSLDDGPSVSVHIPALVLCCDYFLAMLRFGGLEMESFRKNREIVIEDLPAIALKMLIQFCYRRDLGIEPERRTLLDNLGPLILLLRHPTCAEFADLAEAVFRHLSLISTEGGAFLSALVDCGESLSQLPRKEDLIAAWVRQGHHKEKKIRGSMAEAATFSRLSGLETRMSRLERLVEQVLLKLNIHDEE